MTDTLKTVYTGGKINNDLEVALKAVVEQFGYKWHGQGMGLESGKRDICFEKMEKR
jgi:hypothetical protein